MKKVTLRPRNFRYIHPSKADARDIFHPVGAPLETAIECSLKQYRGPILDQDRYSACSAFGTCGMLYSFFKRVVGQSVNFNPWHLYYNTRVRGGWPSQDIGAYPRDIFASLIHDGIIELDLWNPARKMEKPPEFSADEKIFFKGYKRFSLISPEQIQSEFSTFMQKEKLPIGIAINVYKNSIQTAGDTGEFPRRNQNDQFLGGHWIYIDEVFKDGFTIVNSYSEDWGKKGTAFMPWEYSYGYITEAWSLDSELP